MKGKILHTSWGYSMTLNDFCVVIEETPKSVLCKMISVKISSDDGMGGGKAEPVLTETNQKPFRLFKRGDTFKGSYPFCASGESKKMGWFSVWDGRPKHHNTWD